MVIRVLMLGMEACAETEVGEFDVPFGIKEDVVGLDVSTYGGVHVSASSTSVK